MTGQSLTFILSYKYNGEYVAETIYPDQEDAIDGLEYFDVANGEYQIWEYPSGKIYSVKSDRELGPDENVYSTSHTNKGTVWLPVLDEIGIDSDKVKQAYESLSSKSK